MIIDIRVKDDLERVDEIKFSDNSRLYAMGEIVFNIVDYSGDRIEVDFDDIDNLKLALDKAKELWGPK